MKSKMAAKKRENEKTALIAIIFIMLAVLIAPISLAGATTGGG